jgi:hypothetical protein
LKKRRKPPTVDDRWALVVSLSNEPRGLGKTRRMEDPVVNRSHRAIFATSIEPDLQSLVGKAFLPSPFI